MRSSPESNRKASVLQPLDWKPSLDVPRSHRSAELKKAMSDLGVLMFFPAGIGLGYITGLAFVPFS